MGMIKFDPISKPLNRSLPVARQGRGRVLLAGVQYRGPGRRKSLCGVQGQSPVRGPRCPQELTMFCESAMGLGKRFKAFTIHTVMCRRGTPYKSKMIIG